MFVFFFSFAYAADQATYALRDEMAALTTKFEQARAQDNFSALDEANTAAFEKYLAESEFSVEEIMQIHRATSGFQGYAWGGTLWFARKDECPRYHAIIDGIITKISHITHQKMPRIILLVHTAVYNASALTISDNCAIVMLGAELAQDLSDDECEAVLAHELGHIMCNHSERGSAYIRALDTIRPHAHGCVSGIILGMILSPLINTFTKESSVPLAASILTTSMVLYKHILNATAPVIHAALAGTALRYIRKLEYEADKKSALVTKNPGALVQALTKCHQHATGSDALTPYWKQMLIALFTTHPALADRVAALEKIAASIAQEKTAAAG